MKEQQKKKQIRAIVGAVCDAMKINRHLNGNISRCNGATNIYFSGADISCKIDGFILH